MASGIKNEPSANMSLVFALSGLSFLVLQVWS